MNDDEIITVSPLTGTVYAVSEFEEVADGKLKSKDKRKLPREEHDISALHGPARRVYEQRHKDNNDN